MSALPRSFRFRLNCIDHYQATPTSFDPPLHRTKGLSQKQAPTVPVIRVFGATETGQKVCAHIHGAFPYLYVPYDGELDEEHVKVYIESLTLSINHALALSYRRNPYDHGTGTFVAHISLVKGVPFFGYNVGFKTFTKVYLLNPLNMNRLADLLIQGAVLARFMQPHESHMQYLAQWMCDYNLFGCSFIDCEKVRFRAPLPVYDDPAAASAKDKWHAESIRSEWMSDETEVQRQSHTTLEVDVMVQDILNRREIQPRNIHQDFMERFLDLAPNEKYVHSMAGLWRDETNRRRKKMGLKEADGSSPFPPEVMVSMSADPRATKSDWIHEEEMRELIRGLIEHESLADGRRTVDFDHFLKSKDGLKKIQSAFESKEELFPENLAKSDIGEPSLDRSTQTPAVLVNEDTISRTTGDIDDGYHSDEDAAKEIFLASRQQAAEVETTNDEGQADEAAHKKETSTGISNDVDCAKHSSSDRVSEPAEHFVDHPSSIVKVLANPNAEAPASKRKQSQNEDVAEDLETIKRRKLMETPMRQLLDTDGKANGILSTGKPSIVRKVTFAEPPGNKTSEAPTSSNQLSQSSIKARGTKAPSSLAFPVVKNAHAPETELRMSQRDEYSNVPTDARKPLLEATTPLLEQKINLAGVKETSVTPFTTTKSNSSDKSPARQISKVVRQMSKRLGKGFLVCDQNKVYLCSEAPPTSEEVTSSMLDHNLPPVIYQDAYYSKEEDIPELPREYAGRMFKLGSHTVPFLPEFDPSGASLSATGERPPVVRDKKKEEAEYEATRTFCTLRNWEYALPPPSFKEVEAWSRRQRRYWKGPWLEREDSGQVDGPPSFGEIKSYQHPGLSQIEGPTQKNEHGFKFSRKQKATSVEHETQYMILMSLEVHVNSRGNLVPDPAEDEIACIVWSIQADVKTSNTLYKTGVLVLSDEDGIVNHIRRSTSVEVVYEDNELDLLNRLVDIVRDLDPDILTGYEVHNGSWGYLIERARVQYEFDLCDELSRMKSQSHGRFGKDADRWGFTTTSTIRVTGRHMINIWRAMRGELNLLQYTMENVAFHLLHRRIPHYAFADLTRWYQSGKARDIAKTVNYFLSRCQINLQILEANELIPRTSEQARLLGVDFFSVFSRGSQFKVESIMFRIAKPENFILVSPSRKQVGQQNALECLPLVMEPQSAFYPSPLLVLDFQSLYPSVMIAYNYCYSTFLGRVVSWRGTNKMGFTDFKREPRLLELVKDYINIAPNGIMYVKPEMRKSLLAKMLSELLETRVMVKSGMKQDKDDRTLQQLLNNRQLALKLLANVTYGYTSASFSGRMPCSEIADSIVQTGRETLEKAIAFIHSVERWGAEVVYGDTDSLFVYLKGRTRDQAFDIGKDIAEAVTATNPRPVKLKFEKVYHPCVLLAKKRYVGFKYEHKNQQVPEFDAKGIETVRRDGTPADQKIEEKALKLLFRTQDLSKIKDYFQTQCTKIMMGKVSIQDFLFAKEVKLGTYADKGPPPPGALIATRKMLQDARQEPQYGERVPYVVITGAPGARLIDRCVDPEVILNNDQVELDAEYYITKNIIPPLERIFNLVGANVKAWFDDMPKVQRIRAVRAPAQLLARAEGAAKKTLESYLHNTTCLVCRAKLPRPVQITADDLEEDLPLPICDKCLDEPEESLYALQMRRGKAQKRVRNIRDVCRSCSSLSCEDEIKCDSRDCPVFYTRVKETSALASLEERGDSVMEALENDLMSDERTRGHVHRQQEPQTFFLDDDEEEWSEGEGDEESREDGDEGPGEDADDQSGDRVDEGSTTEANDAGNEEGDETEEDDGVQFYDMPAERPSKQERVTHVNMVNDLDW